MCAGQRRVCPAGSTGISTLRAGTSSQPSSFALLRLRGGISAAIQVKMLRGKMTTEVFEVEVQEHATVLDLKRQLAILKGYPASQDDLTAKTAMKIMHLGNILKDDVVVASLVRPPSFVVMLPPKTLEISTRTLARDLEYEQAHLAPDSEGEMMIKCKNFDLCEALLPTWECKGCCRCTNCDIQFGNFTIIFEEREDECGVCLETTMKQAKITPHCSHWFCVPCARKLVGCDPQWLAQYELSMVPYGCPPCPNGCANPVQGVQCYCEEYYAEGGIYEQWFKECPEDHRKHGDDEERTLKENRQPLKCPLCRASLVSGQWHRGQWYADPGN